MHTPIRPSLLLTATLLLIACSPASEAPATSAHPEPDTIAPAPAADTSGSAFTIEDAWIRSAPPGAPALAGYATLRNDTAAAVTVRTCPSEGFASTELHETLHEGGMARMRPVGELVVPADRQVALAPAATHLMLTQPAELPAAGAQVAVCLSVDGDPRQVAFEVRPASGAAMSHDHDHAGAHEH